MKQSEDCVSAKTENFLKGEFKMSVGATLLVFIFIGGYFVWKCIND